MSLVTMPLQGTGNTQTSNNTIVKTASCYDIFKKCAVWLTKPTNAFVVINITISGLSVLELLQTGDYEVCYDALTHAVTAISFLYPSKVGNTVGMIMNLARGIWIGDSIVTGDSIVPPLANGIDFLVHSSNMFMYTYSAKVPLLVEESKNKTD